MKKIFSFVMACIFIIVFTFSANAQVIDSASPYWLNTFKIYMCHDWNQGDADCVIEVVGYSGVTLINNIDITFLQEDYNGGWTEIARWDDLSVASDYFLWEETIENTPYGYTYRLTLSFDIYRNGTVEHIDEYFDKMY